MQAQISGALRCPSFVLPCLSHSHYHRSRSRLFAKVFVTKQLGDCLVHAHPIFIAAIALSVVGTSVAVQAEQPKRLPQIGFLSLLARDDFDPAAKDPIKEGLLEGLKALNLLVTLSNTRSMSSQPGVHRMSKPPCARATAPRSSSSLVTELTGWSTASPGLGAT
jgi:hypothetical protein